MVESKKTIFIILFLLFAKTLSFAQGDEITITTYYPSPHGVYNTLRLSPQPRPDSCNAGEMYYDSTDNIIYYCDGSVGQWESLGTKQDHWVLDGTNLEGKMSSF